MVAEELWRELQGDSVNSTKTGKSVGSIESLVNAPGKKSHKKKATRTKWKGINKPSKGCKPFRLKPDIKDVEAKHGEIENLNQDASPDPGEEPSKNHESLVENAISNPAMLLRMIQRDVNLLNDEDVSKRKASLCRLNNFFTSAIKQSSGDESEKNIKKVLNEAFDTLLKPLLKRFDDKSEKCRELAILLVTIYLEICEDLGLVMPYFFPALMERSSNTFLIDFEQKVVVRDIKSHEDKMRGKSIQLPDSGTVYKHKVAEPSEELRLLLCKMLGTLLVSITSRGLHAMLGPYFHDTIMFFHACAVDPFPELKNEGMNYLAIMASEERMSNTMHHYCTPLVRSIMPALRHRHARVRSSCIRCVRSLVKCPFRNKCRGGGTEAIVDLMGYREDNVIPVCAFYQGETRLNYFGSLVADCNPSVRLEYFKMLSDWMTKLIDRWDHWPRLIPFLLAGVSDELPEIQELTLSTLEELGIQYEEEHPDEIVEKRQYGVDGAQQRANYEKKLPPPWTKRPRIGTRLFVRSHVRRVIKPVLTELNDWRSKTKSKAVGLLKTCLVYMEEHITMDFHLFAKAALALIDDSDIASQMECCAEIAGRYLEPDTYLPILLPIIRGEEGTISALEGSGSKRKNALTFLSNLLKGAKAKVIIPSFTKIVYALVDEDILRIAKESQALKAKLLSTISVLLQSISLNGTAVIEAHFLTTGRLTTLEKHFFALYMALIKLNAAKSDIAFKYLAKAQLEIETDLQEDEEIDRLHSLHANRLLDDIHKNVATNHEYQWSLLYSFFNLSGCRSLDKRGVQTLILILHSLLSAVEKLTEEKKLKQSEEMSDLVLSLLKDATCIELLEEAEVAQDFFPDLLHKISPRIEATDTQINLNDPSHERLERHALNWMKLIEAILVGPPVAYQMLSTQELTSLSEKLLLLDKVLQHSVEIHTLTLTLSTKICSFPGIRNSEVCQDFKNHAVKSIHHSREEVRLEAERTIRKLDEN